MMKLKYPAITLASIVVALVVIFVVVFLYYPRLYTPLESINDYNTCFELGYPVTAGGPYGGNTCTLPNGKVFHSHFG